MLVRFTGCRDVVLPEDVCGTLKRMADVIREVSDIRPPTIYGCTVDVCSLYDLAWVKAAEAVARSDADGETPYEVDDMILALAIRGLLRIAGIHARVRLVQEGRTTREHLRSARDVASYLGLLVSYD